MNQAAIWHFGYKNNGGGPKTNCLYTCKWMFKGVGADMLAIGSGYKNTALYIVFAKIIYRKARLQKRVTKTKNNIFRVTKTKLQNQKNLKNR